MTVKTEGNAGHMLSENLFHLRKRNKMTQEQLANELSVSRQAVAKWETGETTPDISNCLALAKLFDVSLDDLVNYSEEQQGLPLPPKGKYLFGAVTVDAQGGIVLPEKARKLFQIMPGEQLVVLGDEKTGLALLKTDFMIDFLNNIQDGLQ